MTFQMFSSEIVSHYGITSLPGEEEEEEDEVVCTACNNERTARPVWRMNEPSCHASSLLLLIPTSSSISSSCFSVLSFRIKQLNSRSKGSSYKYIYIYNLVFNFFLLNIIVTPLPPKIIMMINNNNLKNHNSNKFGVP